MDVIHNSHFINRKTLSIMPTTEPLKRFSHCSNYQAEPTNLKLLHSLLQAHLLPSANLILGLTVLLCVGFFLSQTSRPQSLHLCKALKYKKPFHRLFLHTHTATKTKPRTFLLPILVIKTKAEKAVVVS